MRAIARAMARICAWIGRLLTRCSVTLEKLSASEAEALQSWPGQGHAQDMGASNFVIVYRVQGDVAQVLQVLHAAQQ